MPKRQFSQLSTRKRKAIYRICLELFAEHGYGNTSIKMITKRLDVADGYLYYYFNGKEDLTKWVLEIGIDAWHEHFENNVANQHPKDLFELFKLSTIQMANFIKKNKSLFGTYVQLLNEPKFPLTEWMAEQVSWFDAYYLESLMEEIGSGRIRSDIPPMLIALVMSVVNIRIQNYFWNPQLDAMGISNYNDKQLAELADQINSIFRQGMLPQKI